MVEDTEVDRLKRRLTWEGAGPITDLSNRATDTLTAQSRAFADWVRGMGEERPLISLLIAFQIGFAVGRWGSRRAQH
jgi:hypothetical protein